MLSYCRKNDLENLKEQASKANKSRKKTIRLLQLSDTTELDYSTKKSKANLGPLNFKNRRGLLLHNSLLLSDLGIPLGLLNQSYHIRNDADFAKSESAARRAAPAESKESYRWIEHFLEGQSLCEAVDNLELVYVADREADNIALFQALKHSRASFVIRSNHNRRLKGQSLKLHDHLAKQAAAGGYKTEIIDAQEGRREAKLEVRFCQVALHPKAFKKNRFCLSGLWASSQGNRGTRRC